MKNSLINVSKDLAALRNNSRSLIKKAADLAKTTTSELRSNQSLSVIVLLDASGSMEGSSMHYAKKATSQYCVGAIKKRYQVGLISFTDTASYACSLTSDISQIDLALQRIDADSSTNLTAAFQLARKILNGVTGKRMICVITDGMPDCKSSAIEESRLASNEGIEIMAIGTDGANQEFLDQIATATELAAHVPMARLEETMKSMVLRLPG